MFRIGLKQDQILALHQRGGSHIFFARRFKTYILDALNLNAGHVDNLVGDCKDADFRSKTVPITADIAHSQ
jgi:hypothetical protein